MKRILLLSLFCAVSSLHAYQDEALFYSWDANTSYLRIGMFPSHVQSRIASKAGEYNEVLDRAKFKEIAMRLVGPHGTIDTLMINSTNGDIATILGHLSAFNVNALKVWGRPNLSGYGAALNDLNELIGAIAANFPELKKLSFIHAEDNYALRPSHVKRLSALRLKHLQANFENPPYGEYSVFELRHQLISELSLFKDSLEELSLGDDTWITERAAVNALASLSGLKKLTVRGPISPEAIDAINGFKNLTHLNLAKSKRMNYPQVLSILETHNHLQMFAFPNYPAMKTDSLSDSGFTIGLNSVLNNIRSKPKWALQFVGFADSWPPEEYNRKVAVFENAGVKVVGKTEYFMPDYSEEWKKHWKASTERPLQPSVTKEPAPVFTNALYSIAIGAVLGVAFVHILPLANPAG